MRSVLLAGIAALALASCAPSAAKKAVPEEEEILDEADYVDDEPEPDRKRSRRRDDDDEDEHPKNKKKPSRDDDEDEDDERPKNKKKSARDEDEEDESLKSKKKAAKYDDEDEDEDVKPRSKKKPSRDDEDDEDETPKSKKKSSRYDDDEDDETPRSKKKASRYDDEDDEEDDYPRKKPKKKKGNKTLVLLLAIGLPVFLAIVGGGAYLLYSLLFAGGASSDMLAWMPSNTTTVGGMKMANFRSNSKLKTQAMAVVARIDALGIPFENIEETLQTKGAADVLVVRTATALTEDQLKKPGATPQVVAGQTYYRTNGGMCYHLASPKLLVSTMNESTMKDLLNKERKVTVSSDLQSLVGRASGDRWEAMVNEKDSFDGTKSNLMTMRINGNQINVSVSGTFKDVTTATAAENQARKVFEQPAQNPFGPKFGDAKVSRSGEVLTITFTVSTDDKGFGLGLGF